jgi:hypothetical protein
LLAAERLRNEGEKASLRFQSIEQRSERFAMCCARKPEARIWRDPEGLLAEVEKVENHSLLSRFLCNGHDHRYVKHVDHLGRGVEGWVKVLCDVSRGYGKH